MAFYENFISLCNSIHKSPTAAILEIGLERSSGTRWKKGGMPSDATARRIADYFGVTVDYLTGKSDSREKPALQAENGLDEEFIRSYSRLNETNKAQIDSLIQFLLSQQGQ